MLIVKMENPTDWWSHIAESMRGQTRRHRAEVSPSVSNALCRRPSRRPTVRAYCFRLCEGIPATAAIITPAAISASSRTMPGGTALGPRSVSASAAAGFPYLLRPDMSHTIAQPTRTKAAATISKEAISFVGGNAALHTHRAIPDARSVQDSRNGLPPRHRRPPGDDWSVIRSTSYAGKGPKVDPKRTVGSS
jgi:hypothetical protein